MWTTSAVLLRDIFLKFWSRWSVWKIYLFKSGCFFLVWLYVFKFNSKGRIDYLILCFYLASVQLNVFRMSFWACFFSFIFPFIDSTPFPNNITGISSWNYIINYIIMYRGTKGTSEKLNTFFEMINITINSRIVAVNSTLVQPTIRSLHNHQFDACTTVKLTLVQPLI